jgi:hypothetical protein
MAVTQISKPTQEIRLGRGALAPVYAIAAGGLLLYLFAAYLCAIFPHYPVPNDTVIYLYRQDRWLLLAGTSLLLLASIGLRDQVYKLHLSRAMLVTIAIAVIGFCWFGHQWILCNFDLSRDEQLAVFDSQIFRSGHLVQPLPVLWQAHANALNTLFMFPVSHPIAWVSVYLPMNALLRAAVGLVGDPSLTGPLMVALGMFALWKCARILWPDDREAAIVAVLLYIGSGQVLFAGMTAYAMPAHLALDLVWLCLFLLDRRGTDVAALLVGFVATGLHQPLFHPLFAAPILFLLLRDRNWRRILLYAMGYAAICAFWLAWPIWMHALVAGPHSVTTASGTDYFSRLMQTVAADNPMRWPEMAANLLRFFAWQHLLLVPLLVAAAPVIRREPLAAAFTVSLLLPVMVVALILPYQGYGFGYRYMQGVLGVAILLAVYGWHRLVTDHVWIRPLLLRTSILGLVVLLPMQVSMAHSFYAPYAAIEQQISTSGADYFIIGWEDDPGTREFVNNRPDLSNRPVRLLSSEVGGALIRDICHPGVRVTMPTSALLRPIEAYFAVRPSATADVQIISFSRRLTAAGCTLDRLDAR